MNRHLNRFANLFVLLLCMLSLCALARDSFSLLLPDETFLWLALLCLLLWLATTFRRGVLIGLPLSALVLWYLYQERSFDLLTEMKDMLDRISSVYYGSYATTNALITADGAAGNHMVGILFIFFVLAAFVAAALGSGSFRVSLTILGTLPVFALCIAVNGTPQIFPVLGYLLSLVGAQLGGDVFRLNDGAGKSLFLGIIPCLVVLAALLLLYNPKTYEPTEHDISLSQRFDKLGNRLAEWLSENDENSDNRQQPLSATAPAATVTATPAPKVHHAPSGWDQESDNLDLTASFDASALDDEAFRVTADTAGSLYFRGKNYGDYDGTSWSAAVENSRGSALSFVGQAIAGMSDTVSGEFQLKSSAAYDVLYLPYYSITATDGDVMVPSEQYKVYGGVYYLSATGADALAAAASLPADLQSEELQYREYAHNYYTRLPDSTRSVLSSICAAQGWSAGQDGILWRVAEYVRSQGVYDVNVAPYPSDDYAVYFLTESHTGYCIHFATAAVALYRTLGIPARICEGYLVNNSTPGRSVRVTGSDAHAWAEVYCDGLGWIPVEVTASAAEGDNQPAEGSVAPTPQPNSTEAPDTPAEQQTPPPQETASGDGEGQDETPSGNDDTSPDPYANQPGTQNAGAGSPEGAAQKRLSPALVAVLSILGALAVTAGVLYGRYRILRLLLQKHLTDPDSNMRAVRIYRQAARVLRYGGDMPKELQETAEKARFSQHEISEEELLRSTALLDQLTVQVYDGLNRRKKFMFRYLSGNL